ncbi:MAG TPA: glycosyltransferase [Pedobacter sp.]|nr:glycosyltransferase [Pedobacter sp.]
MEVINFILSLGQILIGYNLVLSGLIYFLWLLLKKSKHEQNRKVIGLDYAFIVTAYEHTDSLPAVVNSILKSEYQNYLIYVVADNCDITDLNFNNDERVITLRPPVVLSSNTKSHAYAVEHFVRPHDVLTIIDSDNLVEEDYLAQLNTTFNQGYDVVQGLRAAKNLTGTIACLDAARDIYYHFYDGKLLFEIGSSATLSGSGMAFKVPLYKAFLTAFDVKGAGFDKVLQSWLVGQDIRIAFNEDAVVLDEKTSRPDQLVKQRSRWINTWFKYFKYGFGLFFKGIATLNRNQAFFGLVLLRPPLFLFLFGAVFCLLMNLIFFDLWAVVAWLTAMALFVVFFFVALLNSHTDRKIYRSLKSIPSFMMYQILSLFKSRNANKISVATKHYYTDEQETRQ